MRICIPVEEFKGLESVAYGHFGSAPYFLIYDSETKEIKGISNGDLGHEHGKCQPLKAIEGEKVDFALVGGIGKGALLKLEAEGIKVYRAEPLSAEENIRLFGEDKLQRIGVQNSCTHDHCETH